MDSRYTMHHFDADIPEDDPRWKDFMDAVSRGFYGSRPDNDSLERRRLDAKGDRARLTYVTCSESLVGPDEPIATYASWDGQLNVGHGRLMASDFISEVTVASTHRRRGLLRAMITKDLTQAKQRGQAFASLTASGGNIYGRFGFGIATRYRRYEISTRHWELREPADGRVELVDARGLGDVLPRLFDAMLRTNRSAHQVPAYFEPYITGEYNYEDMGKDNKKVRAAAHYDEAGQIDAVMFYHVNWDEQEVTVHAKVTPTMHQFLQLVDALCHMDWLETVKLSDPFHSRALKLALVNDRAAKVVKEGDDIWLRILDPIAALSQRGWDRDGDLVVQVVDPLGFADGVFAVHARDGRADVAASEEDPQISIDVAALASAYFGVTPINELAAAGRVRGPGAAAAHRLFQIDDIPANNVGF